MLLREVFVRVLVEEGGIIRCKFSASTVIFNNFVIKIVYKKAYKNTVRYTAENTVSTEEVRIIRICILGAICIFNFDANQKILPKTRIRESMTAHSTSSWFHSGSKNARLT